MMGGQTGRRADGRMRSVLALVGAGVLLTASPPARLPAQEVGHDPTHSPYHDVPRGGGPLFTMGYLSGHRGVVGVGPSSGTVWGLRWHARVGGMTTLVGNLAYAQTNRFVVNPAEDRKSTRLNSSHVELSYAVFCLQKKKIIPGEAATRNHDPFLCALASQGMFSLAFFLKVFSLAAFTDGP